MSSPTAQPHIYKKGTTIIKLKPLAIRSDKLYFFNSTKGSIQSIINHLNNVNEVCGRILLGIWKINSFFGLSKDPSESSSKSPSVFNTAKTIFKSGGVDNTALLKEIKSLLESQNSRIKNLENNLKAIDAKIEPEPLTKDEVKELKDSIQFIRDKLKDIIG
ncbi:putative aphid transmission protein [Isatis caulimovirus A]|nr:putative aphid transmission protein [Isatis caulimovirus A]